MLLTLFLFFMVACLCKGFRLPARKAANFKRDAISNHIYNIANVVAAPIFGVLGDEYLRSQSYQQAKFAKIASSKDRLSFNLDDTPLIPCDSAAECIRNALNSRRCGVSILYAPAGSGKTTLLLQESLRRKESGEHVLYTVGVPDKAYFMEILRLKSVSTQISELVSKPKHTVIILDQIDEDTVRSGLRSFIRELAVDSTRFKTYSVLVAVSQVTTAKMLLKLNGHTKIRQISDGSHFRWNVDQIRLYIDQCAPLHALSADDQAVLRELALVAGTPIFLYNVASSDSPHDELHSGDAAVLANELSRKWRGQEQLISDLRVDNTVE